VLVAAAHGQGVWLGEWFAVVVSPARDTTTTFPRGKRGATGCLAGHRPCSVEPGCFCACEVDAEDRS
jgi:hypothetical protein